MPFLVGDVIQAKIFTYSVDQVGLNVVHYRCIAADAANTQTINVVASNLDTRLALPYKASLSVASQYRGVRAQQIQPFLGVEATSSTNPGNGTIAGDILPKQTCGIATKTSNLGGRSGRGRIYFPFPPEANSDATGLPDAGYRGLLGNICVQLFANFTVGVVVGDQATFTPIIFRRAPLTVSPAVTGYVVRTKWATQRRRGSYGRVNTMPF